MFLIALLAAVLIDGPMPEAGTLRGEAAIEPYGTGGIVVYIDTNRDDSFDRIFRLQVEERHRDAIVASARLDREIDSVSTDAVGWPGPTYLENVTVEFASGYVRVSSGHDAIELFVEGTQSPAWNPDGARVWRRAGYGLIHEVREESGIDLKRREQGRSITAEYCDASSDCDPADTGAGGSGSGGGVGGSGTTLCDAGGPGSTSCSVTSGLSCTSNCGTGYYSCCMYGSPPKCRCIRG
jgi:hypothetical protein